MNGKTLKRNHQNTENKVKDFYREFEKKSQIDLVIYHYFE